MPLRIKCPSCETVLTVSDESRGKQIRCRECDNLLKVPAGRAGRDDPDPPPRSRGEEISERPHRRIRDDDRDDDIDDREDRRRRREEAGDRPRRRSRVDDDWDDDGDEGSRSRRSSSASKSPLPWILGGIGGGVAVVGGLVALVLILRSGPAPVVQPVVGRPPVGQAEAGQPPVGRPPAVGQPPIGQPPVGQPPIGQPPIGQPAVGQPPIGQPPIGQPPIGQPGAGQPPVGQPIAAGPIGQGAAGPLRYQLRPGASYLYMLTLVANRPDGVETTKTNIELRVKSAAGGQFELTPNVSPLSKHLQANVPGGFPRFPGPPHIGPPRFMGPRVLTINSAGDVVRTSGEDTQLPYLLGSAALFVLEPLPNQGEPRWQRSHDITIREIKKLFPFARFGPQNTRDSSAKETITYELGGVTGAVTRIKKTYDLRTLAQDAAGTPQLHVRGNADISFATDVGAVKACAFKATYAVTDNGVTTSLPLNVTYRLLDDAEAVAYKKQQEEARAQALERIKEMNRPKPITDAEIASALANLKSSDFFTFKKAAERLAKSIPVDNRRAEVAGALVAALGNSNGPLRADAVKALKTWAQPKDVPAFIRMLKDTDVFVRFAAIEALGEFKDSKGAAAVAELLPELQVRMQATKALKSMGTPAEKAVIPFVKHGDWVVRMEACQILKEIGTGESLGALQAAQGDSNGLVSRKAREAVEAIQRRGGKAGGA